MATNEETNAAGTDTVTNAWLKNDYDIHGRFDTTLHPFSRTLQQRKEDLFDEYERFRAIGNESIHDYFVRFHKLVNDMIYYSASKSTHSEHKLCQQFPPSGIANLLKWFQKAVSPTNNQLWTSSNSKTHATVHDGQIVTEPIQRGEGHMLKAEAFLADVDCTAPYDQPQALTTTNMFQANHEDAYDSDVDEGPNAAVAFMAKL
ncbi:hypothetical protein Tco_0575454 [Tanacetum coccineum]